MTSEADLAELIEVYDPEVAFERLAHEHRLETLLVLAETGELPFEELRREVGADDPGGFNYHLQRLVGLFVEKADDLYRLTPAGNRVVGAVLSGAFSSDLAGGTVETDGACPRCDAGLSLSMEQSWVSLHCQDCDFRYNRIGIPPRALSGHEPSSIYPLIDRWVKRWITTATFGFCPRCDGQMGRTVLMADDPEDWGGSVPGWIEELPVEAVVQFDCRRCDEERYAHVASVAALHPVIAGFHYDHGIDIRSEPLFDLEWLSLGVAEITNREPLRVEVSGNIGDADFEARFDRTFSLVDSTTR